MFLQRHSLFTSSTMRSPDLSKNTHMPPLLHRGHNKTGRFRFQGGEVAVDYFSGCLSTSITLSLLENINSQRISSFDATLHYRPDAVLPTFCLKLV